jgi:predicted AAA+ superfamily ATPase
MDIIHGVDKLDPQAYPRAVDRSLDARLRIMPAVVVTGARQTGKSTLVQLWRSAISVAR